MRKLTALIVTVMIVALIVSSVDEHVTNRTLYGKDSCLPPHALPATDWGNTRPTRAINLICWEWQMNTEVVHYRSGPLRVENLLVNIRGLSKLPSKAHLRVTALRDTVSETPVELNVWSQTAEVLYLPRRWDSVDIRLVLTEGGIWPLNMELCPVYLQKSGEREIGPATILRLDIQPDALILPEDDWFVPQATRRVIRVTQQPAGVVLGINVSETSKYPAIRVLPESVHMVDIKRGQGRLVILPPDGGVRHERLRLVPLLEQGTLAEAITCELDIQIVPPPVR